MDPASNCRNGAKFRDAARRAAGADSGSLTINQTVKFKIGLDLGGTKIEVAALDAGRRILERRRMATPDGDYDAILAAIRTLIDQTEQAIGAQASVGVATPGSLSPATGLLRNSNSICLNGKQFKQDLEHALGRPVRIANDANCFALSEAVDGAAAGAGIVFGVILGGGVVVDAKVLTGANAIAGEWGHNPLPAMREDERPGPVCGLRPSQRQQIGCAGNRGAGVEGRREVRGDAIALRGAARTNSCQRDQCARSRRDRAGRRAFERQTALRKRAAAAGAARILRHGPDTRGEELARRFKRGARRRLAVVDGGTNSRTQPVQLRARQKGTGVVCPARSSQGRARAMALRASFQPSLAVRPRRRRQKFSTRLKRP